MAKLSIIIPSGDWSQSVERAIEASTRLGFAFRALSLSTEAAAYELTLVGRAMDEMRPVWLVEQSGNWPDDFVLLNRYLRTGVEPDYFDSEMKRRWAKKNAEAVSADSQS
jgi:hypothetical protein